VSDGIRRRPVERLRPAPPEHVRRALALTRREIVFLAAGAGAASAWWTMFGWC
jgi:hypothetical protein